METQVKLKPARKFGPGYFIREQMEYRNWTQEDLSEVLSLTTKHVNKILQDKQPITLEMAKVLAKVFESSPQYWLNLDANYRLWLSSEKTEKEINADIKSKIYERMPIKDMVAKGWISSFNSSMDLEKQVLDFWGLDKLDFSSIDSKLVPCLTKKSEAFNQFNASYALTWFHKAEMVAEKLQHVPYSKEKLVELFNQIHVYTTNLSKINDFIEELNKIGVLFFVLPHLQKTYLDGAAFLSGENPVIVYTGRYKRIDNFWFTVAHEIAHILHHLDSETPFILDNLKDGEKDTLEIEANKIAAEKLMHSEISSFLESSKHYLTTTKVEECAEIYQIHPSIVIGKLAHDGSISYSNQNLYNENVLSYIPENLKF